MRIIPAIDIIDGKCVRLTQGDYGQMKVYREDPVEVAMEFEEADLEYLHLVDLDGAKKGKVVNWKVIEEIQEKTALKVDFGGGVKTAYEVSALLELGVNQVNIGSLAVKNPETFIAWIKEFGAQNFILSADVQDDNVYINGWLESADLRLYDLVSKFEKEGLEYLACTDIRSDGMLTGPNFELYKKLKSQFPKLKIIASGGVSSIDDLLALKELKVEAVIVGKAIYENKIKLSDLSLIQKKK
jgi:phosphoribosylformimino-5-aminoimidazole carboxamide ribotide isomerase